MHTGTITRRTLATLAAIGAVLTGVAVTASAPAAHAASAPVISLTSPRPVIPGDRILVKAAGLPARDHAVTIALGYQHDGGGAGGTSLTTTAVTSATGSLQTVVTVPADLPSEYLTTSSAIHDYVSVRSGDGSVSGQQSIRITASRPTITLSADHVVEGRAVHVDSTGWVPGEVVRLRVDTDTQTGSLPVLTSTTANAAGLVDTDVQLDRKYTPEMLDSDVTVMTAESDDALARATTPLRIAPRPETMHLSTDTTHPGSTLTLDTRGWESGADLTVTLGWEDPDRTMSAGMTLAEVKADGSGAASGELTVPQLDLIGADRAYADPEDVYIEVQSGDSTIASLRTHVTITPTPTDLSGVPASCQDTRPGGADENGPAICVYNADGQSSARPGDVMKAVGTYWKPRSEVSIYAVLGGCATNVGTGGGCTVNPNTYAWSPGTAAVLLGKVTTGDDGAIAPQRIKIPADLPSTFIGDHDAYIVAIGPHTSVYPRAGDAMGTIDSNWTVLAPTPAQPTPTPTPKPPTPSPKTPTPTTPRPTPTPTTPTHHRTTTVVTDPPSSHRHTPLPTPSRSTAPPLAHTGARTGALLAVGGLLLLGGALMLLLGRARRGGARRA